MLKKVQTAHKAEFINERLKEKKIKKDQKGLKTLEKIKNSNQSNYLSTTGKVRQ